MCTETNITNYAHGLKGVGFLISISVISNVASCNTTVLHNSPIIVVWGGVVTCLDRRQVLIRQD